MFNLGQVGVGVAVVDKRIEKLRSLPDTFLTFVQAKIFFLLRHHVVERLVSMIEAIKLGDTWSCFLVVLAKLVFGLPFPVSASQKVIPFVDIFQRSVR